MPLPGKDILRQKTSVISHMPGQQSLFIRHPDSGFYELFTF